MRDKQLHCLVITPFTHDCGTVTNIRSKVLSLKAIGLKVVLLTPETRSIESLQSDVLEYWQAKSINTHHYGLFSRCPKPNKLDQWLDDDFEIKVDNLNKKYQFNLCIINYAFLSRAFLYLNRSCTKLLETHDVFTLRNKKLYDFGFRKKTEFWYSCTQEDEALALQRADYVLALTDSDRDWFRYIEKKNTEKILLQPPILKAARVANINRSSNSPQIVGYIASYNTPNKEVIRQLVRFAKKNRHIHFLIAGQISLMVKKNIENIQLESSTTLEDFYNKCDVIINIDQFESGIKIKTVEAFAKGKALLCTKNSSLGIKTSSPLHQFKDENNLFCFLKLNYPFSQSQLIEFQVESLQVYSLYEQRYSYHLLWEKVGLI
jgi:hypothetical protein